MRFLWTLVFLALLTVPSYADVAAADLPAVRAKAEEGDAVAEFGLGGFYYEGTGVKKDVVEAAKWTRKAAEQGLVDAQCVLGIHYAGGLGVPKDYAEAAKWWRKAADQGNLRSQRHLGDLYERGLGVPQNFEEAYFWYVLAATSGDKTAVAMRDRTIAQLSQQQVAEVQKRASAWKPTPTTVGAK